MRTALVLGGAATLHDDLARYAGPTDGVVACNDAGAEWPGRLDAWVTLHPEFFDRWLRGRNSAGLYLVAHRQPKPHFDRVMNLVTGFKFPGMEKSGSSGLFAAKVALCDLGFDRAVLCGIPMEARAAHFFDGKPWKPAEDFRRQWLTIPAEYRARLRSMSGWTRTLFGAPEWNHTEENRHGPSVEQSH